MSNPEIIEADFEFIPSDPAKARSLSREQVEFFNENGYLAPVAIGDEKEAEERRAYCEHLFELMAAEEDGRDNYGLLGYQTRCGGLWDLIHDPRILDPVEDLLGENIICWSTHYFNKIAKDPKAVPQHQDASYWPLSPHNTVTCWLAIDPSNQENACLEVVPGSHRLGHVKWEKATSPHVMEGAADALSQEVVDPEQYGKLVPVELRAGEMSIHSDKTIHGSRPNTSGNRRCGFAMRFCTPDVKPLDTTWGQNAVLCRGKDEFGHFNIIAERPDGDDIASWREYMMRKFIEERRRKDESA